MGGSSKSSADTSSNTEDNRVVADANGVAIGQGASVDYQYISGLDERAVTLLGRVLDTVDGIAKGAGNAISDALGTTKTVAERQQNIEAPVANTIPDIIKSPIGIILAGAVAIFAFRKGK
jgi:hypothetical protein